MTNPYSVRTLPVLAILLLAISGAARSQIVAFGASNISGWNVAASEATPARLQTMLRAKGYGVTVVNAGIYGNTTTEMRARMDRDIPEGTTIVVLDMSGGLYNDTRKGIGREQGDADLAAIEARLAERHITVIPFNATDIPRRYHQEDGIHLTPEGHRLAAIHLLTEVTHALGPPPEAAVPTATEAVRHACVSDARRLCAAVIGDDAKRHECMQEHRAQLSKDCLRAIAQSRQRQTH